MSEPPTTASNATPSTKSSKTKWWEERIFVSKSYILVWTGITAGCVVGAILDAPLLYAALKSNTIVDLRDMLFFAGMLIGIVVGSIIVIYLILNYIDVAIKKAISAKK